MSGVVGKKNSTLKKEAVKENKLLSTGVKSIKFWHEALADGETSIPFGSLNMPADVAVNGFSNPTSTEILAANLALFHTNVEVHSSLNQKLMEGLTYVVKNNQIKFLNNYEAAEGEIFVVTYKNDTITGTNVVDARPLTATGTLAADDTDFNVGEAFKTNAYPNDQLGEVMVFLDGEIQYRNTANADAGPSADGNYQEVHSTNGFGTIIRFNESFIEDKPVIVISRNLIAERPDISMMQLIENLGGQLDSVLETVAALAGVDITDFQTAPNQVDLKAFGAQVVANRNNISSILDVEVLTDGYNHPDYILDATKTSANHNEDIHTFTNLVVGREYVVRGMVYCEAQNSSDVGYVILYNSADASNPVSRAGAWVITSSSTVRRFGYHGISAKFTAQHTTLRVNIQVLDSGQVLGDSTKNQTFVQLERKPHKKKISELI